MLVQTGKKDPGNPPHKKTSKNTKTVLILLVLYFNIFFHLCFLGSTPWILIQMEKCWDQDQDPDTHNNRCGSETLITTKDSTLIEKNRRKLNFNEYLLIRWSESQISLKLKFQRYITFTPSHK